MDHLYTFSLDQSRVLDHWYGQLGDFFQSRQWSETTILWSWRLLHYIMQPLHARCSRATSRPTRTKFTKQSLKISAQSNSLALHFTAGLCGTPNKSAYPQCRPDDEVESFNLSQDSAIVYRDLLWTLGSETNGSTHCGWIGLGDYHLC